MNLRTTPSNIVTLEPNQVFTFGSNEAGRHGKGAAKFALQLGAKYGIGVGLQGQTYAIPTKDENIQVLPISKIQKYVSEFIEFAKQHTELTFYVTSIGCGLAGFTPQQIAPLFKGAKDIVNIYLPREFITILEKIE